MQPVDVDPGLEPVRLPRHVVDEIFAHARELSSGSPSEECCGLIVGSEQERFEHVVRCRNEMTALHRADKEAFPLDGRRAYWMNVDDYREAQREAAKRNLRITAIYHSHVGEGVYLSPTDIAYAREEGFPFPDADQIVVSVASPGEGRLGARLDEDAEREVEVREMGLFRWEPSLRSFRGHRVIRCFP